MNHLKPYKLEGARSTLLDALRLVAAILVLLHHVQQYKNSDWLFYVSAFGHDAVIFFFILSGFVIAHVTTSKSIGLSQYLQARLARIYSVALPATILSLLLLAIPFGGTPQQETTVLGIAATLVANLTFLSQNHAIGFGLANNGPFWSICYEVCYYLAFAAIFYCKRKSTAALLTGLLFLLFGWQLALLFPIWISGALLHRFLSRNTTTIKPITGAAVCLMAISIYLAIRALNIDDHLFHLSSPTIQESSNRLDFSKRFLPDHLIALTFLIAIWGALIAVDTLPSIPFSRPIKVASESTFSIYLFHYPLIIALAPLLPNAETLVATTLAICILLSIYTERRKSSYAKAINWLFNRFKTAAHHN